MAVDGCGLVCKYIIILFDVIFAVLGIAFLGFGLWLRFSGNTRQIFEIQDLNSSAFVIGVTVLIILGTLMLVVVTFGDYGACCEKRSSLKVFACLVAILAIAEIIIGVLAFTNRKNVGWRMGEFYISLYGVYAATGDPAIAVTLTFLQNMLHCCGISGVPLIDIAKQTCPAPDGFFEQLKMNACPPIIINLFEEKASLVLGIFIGTGALLFIVFICSTTLVNKLHGANQAPQYIILSSACSAPNPQQTILTPSAYPPPPAEEPVVFTPLTHANIPVALA